jgi:plasmid stabilization system protein ParE
VTAIRRYTAKQSGPLADRFSLSRFAHLQRLAQTGTSGVPRDDIRPGLRLAVHGRYNIYFRVTDAETVIVRVVHSARDVTRLQFDDGDS